MCLTHQDKEVYELVVEEYLYNQEKKNKKMVWSECLN